MIFKSYLYIEDYPIIGVYLATINKIDNNSIIILKSEKLNFLKKIQIDDFEEWINYRIAQNWKYINDDVFYGYRFVFRKESLIWNNTQTEWIKPKFPWNEVILKWIKEEKPNLFLKEHEIIKLKKTIDSLNNKIKELENKNK